jgi:hypothetical protein
MSEIRAVWDAASDPRFTGEASADAGTRIEPTVGPTVILDVEQSRETDVYIHARLTAQLSELLCRATKGQNGRRATHGRGHLTPVLRRGGMACLALQTQQQEK